MLISWRKMLRLRRMCNRLKVSGKDPQVSVLSSPEQFILLTFSLNCKFESIPANNARNWSLHAKHWLGLNQNIYILMQPILREMNHHIHVLTILLCLCQESKDYFFPYVYLDNWTYTTQSELILLNFNALQ